MAWEYLSDVLYGGVNPNIPGHGGPECAAFLSSKNKIFDTVVSTCMMITAGTFAYFTYTMPKRFPKTDDYTSKRLMLTLLCLIFGLEVGYKVCSRQVLYLLNPCHTITMVEIYLLAAKPSKLSFCTLRVLIHYVHVTLVAMLFPDTLARQFPGETAVYWIQHTMIFFIVPPYLVYIWGPECLEPFTDWAWPCLGGITCGVQNFYMLQPVAILTEVNLNYVLCPARVDPFNGPYYRTAAVFHQAALLLTFGKIYTQIFKLVLRLLPKHKPVYEKVE